MIRKSSLIISTLAMAAMMGCSKNKSNDPSNTVQGVPEYQTQNVAMQVVTSDAETGLPISGATVTFAGDLAAHVVTTDGKKAASSSLESGVESFYIQEGKTGNLQLSVKANGYLASSKIVGITTGDNTIKIQLASLKGNLKGLDVVSGTVSTNAQGAVTETKTYKADVSTKAEAVSLTIGNGVVLADASGKPVTGELKVDLAVFTPSEPTAMQNVTSDLVVTNAAGKEAVSVVAAYIDLNIASSTGAEVKKLNPAATIEVALDPQVKEPKTGAAFSEGDKLSLWSNSNGVIQYEGEAVVTAGNKVSIQVSHLSSFWVSKDVVTCGANSPKVVFQNANGAALDLSAFAKSGGFSFVKSITGMDTVVLSRFPGNNPDLDFSVLLGLEKVASKIASAVSCGAVITLPITLPANKVLTTKVRQQCAQDASVNSVVPSAPVKVFSTSGIYLDGGKTNADGVKSFTLPQGKGYTVIAKNRDGIADTASITLTDNATEEFLFNIICPELTGAQ